MESHYGQQAAADEWHDVLVNKLMPKETHTIELPDRTVYRVGRTRTSKLGVKKMTEYLEKLEMYCAMNLGLLLPRPDDLMMQIYRERR